MNKKHLSLLLVFAMLFNFAMPVAYATDTSNPPQMNDSFGDALRSNKTTSAAIDIDIWAKEKQQAITDDWTTKYGESGTEALNDYFDMATFAKSGGQFNDVTRDVVKKATVSDQYNFLNKYSLEANAKGLLMIRAIGYDPKDYYKLDFVTKVNDSYLSSYSNIDRLILSLTSLNSDDYSVSNELKALSLLVDKQSNDGSFGNAKITAKAVYALSNVADESDAKEAIEKAVSYIGTQIADESLAFEDLAWYAGALFSVDKAYNQDNRLKRGDKTMLDLLYANSIDNSADFADAVGGSTADESVTKIAYYALTAYNNGTSLFDLSDIQTMASPEMPLYSFDASTGTIKGYLGDDADLIIPDEIDGVAVKHIDEQAFKYAASSYSTKIKVQLTGIVLPKGLETIGKSAFDGNRLKVVTFPSSLKTIGSNAFIDNALESISLNEGLQTIGDKAFAEQKLTEVTIPSTVTEISSSFMKNADLETVAFAPNAQLKTLKTYAFSDCKLSAIDLPEGLESIGQYAFKNNMLTKITLPSTLTIIEDEAFAENGITEVTIPDSVTTFGDDVFAENYVDLSDKANCDYLLTKISCEEALTTSYAAKGIVNPLAVKLIFKTSGGDVLKEQTILGQQLKTMEIGGSSWSPSFDVAEGDGSYLTEYTLPRKLEKLYNSADEADYNIIIDNYYQDGKEYTFKAEEYPGYSVPTPDEKTVTVTKDNHKVVFEYTFLGNKTLTLSGEDLTSNPVAGKLGVNQPITITIKPTIGKEVDSFTVGGEDKKAELKKGLGEFSYSFKLIDNTEVVVTYKDALTNGAWITNKKTAIEDALASDDAAITDYRKIIAYAKAGKTLNQATSSYIANTFVDQKNLDFPKKINGDYIKVHHYAEAILDIRADGHNPKDYYTLDFVAKLDDFDTMLMLDTMQTAKIVMAYTCDDFEAINRDAWIVNLIKKQQDDGSFGDYRETAMAIYALANVYSTNTEAKTAVDKAVTYIGTLLNEYADVNAAPGVAEDIAALVGAISSVDSKLIDSASLTKNARTIVDALRTYDIPNTSDFESEVGTGKVSQEAGALGYAAIVANTSNTALFDLSNITEKPPIVVSPFIVDVATNTITGYRGKTPADGKLVIPAQIDGVAVKHLGKNSLKCSSYGTPSFKTPLTSIVLPEELETIDYMALQGHDITEITIPSTVTAINSGLRINKKLKTVTFAENSQLKALGEDAFYGCAIESINLPKGLKTIGKKALADNSLTAITIPDTVTTIGDSAFMLNVLETATIPNTVTTVGKKLFYRNFNEGYTVNEFGTKKGKLRFTKVYGDAHTVVDTDVLGVVNPVDVKIVCKDSDGNIIKEKITVGQNNKLMVVKPDPNSTWKKIYTLQDGDGADLMNCVHPYDYKIYSKTDILAGVFSNYYTEGNAYTFTPEDIDGYQKPDAQTITVAKDQTVTFVYGTLGNANLSVEGEGITTDPAPGDYGKGKMVKVTIIAPPNKKLATFTVGEEDKTADLTVNAATSTYEFVLNKDTKLAVTYNDISYAKEIELKADKTEFKLGEKTKLMLKYRDKEVVFPSNDFYFEQSPKDFLIIDDKLGEVTATGAGTVTLTAILRTDKTVKDQIALTVKAPKATVTALAYDEAKQSGIDHEFIVPRQEVTVEAGLAKKYGYSNPQIEAHALAGEVTMFDVLVKLNITFLEKLKQAPISKNDYLQNYKDNTLVIGDSGFVTKNFTIETYNQSMFVNDRQPHGDKWFTDNVDYFGYTVDDTVIVDGDDLAFVFIGDQSWGDIYTWFEKDGQKVTEVTVKPNELVDLVLKGYTGTAGLKAEDILKNLITVQKNYQIVTVDDTGKMTEISGLKTDSDGKFSHSFDKAGKYVLGAKSNSTHIFSPFLVVNVGQAASQVDKDALKSAIEQANALDKQLYTDNSVKAFDESVKAGRTVYDNAVATQDEVDAATKVIKDATNALVLKDVLYEYTINYYIDGTTSKVPGIVPNPVTRKAKKDEVISIVYPKVDGYQVKDNQPAELKITGQATQVQNVYYTAKTLPVAPRGDYPSTLNYVPDDFANDLWLSTNYQILNVGEKYQLKSRRVPEIVASGVSPENAHPDYVYEIVEGDSVTFADTTSSLLDVIAVKPGKSVIKVSYKGINAFNKFYAAMSEVNYSYFIVDVVDKDASIRLSTDIKTRSYDTIYYADGDSVPYSFDITTDADEFLVKCNGNEATVNGNTATVNLENRSNIIEVTATKGDQHYSLFYVIDARKIELIIDNLTHPNKAIDVNDEVKVSFKGITMPVYKLATIYNPTWYAPNGRWGPTYGTTIRYNNADLGELITYDPTQYGLENPDNNAIKFTVTAEKIYKFTDGHIDSEWWGSKLGSERDQTSPGQPNFNADTNRDNFSVMPDFEIVVGHPAPVVDKTALKAAIDDANDLDTTSKTEESVKALKGAVKTGRNVFDNAKATQAEVDASLKAIRDAKAALKDIVNYEDALKKSLDKIYSSVSSIDNPGDWSMFTLARGDYELPKHLIEKYKAKITDVIKRKMTSSDDKLHKFKSTEHDRTIIALTSLGIDPRDMSGIDITKALGSLDYIKKQGLNGLVFALIALDTQDYEIGQAPAGVAQAARDNIIDEILSRELVGGGFVLSGSKADPDMTAMTLQALASYKEKRTDVKAVIERGINSLSKLQSDKAGYASFGDENSESAAQVIVALSTLGIDAHKDPRFTKNGQSVLDNLLTFYVKGGGFKHIIAGDINGMATDQGTYALVAYDRMIKGKNTLYDMTNVTFVDDSTPVNPPKPDTPNKSTEPSKSDENIVTLSIDKETIDKGYVLKPTKYKFSEGDTVWDVLKRVLDREKIPYRYSYSEQYGSVYIESIDGDGEFDNGSGSGWMYCVNEQYPNVGASKVELHSGDVIRWRYTTNLGEDLGQKFDDTSAKDDNGASDKGDKTSKQSSKDKNEAAGKSTTSNNDSLLIKENKTPLGSIELAFEDKDAISAWAIESVRQAVSLGAVKGNTNNLFDPQKHITRAEMASMINGLVKEDSFVNLAQTFVDVEQTAWYYAAINRVNQLGLMIGYGKEYKPNDKLTREQFALIASRMVNPQVNDTKVPADINQTSEWAKDAVLSMYNLDIIQGDGTNFDPKGYVTKEMAITILMRAKAYKQNKH